MLSRRAFLAILGVTTARIAEAAEAAFSSVEAVANRAFSNASGALGIREIPGWWNFEDAVLANDMVISLPDRSGNGFNLEIDSEGDRKGPMWSSDTFNSRAAAIAAYKDDQKHTRLNIQREYGSGIIRVAIPEKDVVQIAIQNGPQTLSSSPVIPFGRDMVLAIIVDYTRVRYYVDGVLVGQKLVSSSVCCAFFASLRIDGVGGGNYGQLLQADGFFDQPGSGAPYRTFSGVVREMLRVDGRVEM